MDIKPPQWADRFLTWYCNPDLLEEIQGDAHELYFQRVKNEGKKSADWKYVLDIIRFCRWSNIKRQSDNYKPGYIHILWSLNFKIALRNAFRNKLIFSVKMAGLSLCLAFALLLTAFVIHEFTFDRYHKDYERIFRIGLQVNIQGDVTNFAVSPVALGDGLAEEIPEIEDAFTIMHGGKPAFTADNEIFNNETVLIASSNFLKTLTFNFILGNQEALDEPYKIVLTEKTARKFFGDKDPSGQTVDVDWAQLEVTAVIKDVPANSHLKFDALISWGTYDVNEGWDNINAYTYIKIKDEKDIAEVHPKINTVVLNHRDEIDGGRTHRAGEDITIHPIIENVADIHLAESLSEDIAVKRKKTNLGILTAVIILFFVTGLINFLNLSFAEFTANLRKIRILQVFGGATADHGKVVITNILLTILIVLPLTLFLCYASLMAASHYFSIRIESIVFTSPMFLLVTGVFMLAFIFVTKMNSFILSGPYEITNSLNGKLSTKKNGLQIRGFMVATQLAFSIIMIALIFVIIDQFRFINITDKGFEDKNTIVIKMPPDFSATESFASSVRKLGGVKKVDGGTFYLDNIETEEFFEVDTKEGRKKMLVAYMSCGYDYLDLLNIEMADGRNFQREMPSDDKGAYIINQTAAKEFGWNNPIGQVIHGPLTTDRDAGVVIGVVKDFNFASLHKKIEPLIIFLVNDGWGIRYVYIKVEPLSRPDLIAQIEKEYTRVYPDSPMKWEYLDSKYQSLYKQDYEIRNVFEAGLVISILVSCLGVFSISALLVLTRAKEMGIRKVVGATQLQLFGHHIRSFAKLLFIAVLIAWPVIYYLSSHWLDNFAYHIDLHAWYFVMPGLATLLIIVVIAGYHGFKSSRVNPADILKYE